MFQNRALCLRCLLQNTPLHTMVDVSLYIRSGQNYVVITVVSGPLYNQYKIYLEILDFAKYKHKTYCPSPFVILTSSRHPFRVIKITSLRPIIIIATERSEDGWSGIVNEFRTIYYDDIMKLRSALDVVVKDIESEYGQNWHQIINPYIDRPVL